MFTGIIRHAGRLHKREGKSIDIDCPELRAQLTIGDSVAVNGVCLTVSRLNPAGFGADLLDETLQSTTIGSLVPGTLLNLEPAMRLGDSLGGHMLSGHVEGTARITDTVRRNSGDCELTVTIPPELNKYMILKGSIAIDGVSLTIQEQSGDRIVVKLIPETMRATNLGKLEADQIVNVESDMLVRMVQQNVERILAARTEKE